MTVKNKNGMEKQVGKSDVFTKESLIWLQDKIRTLCIEEFNQVYSLDSTLKQNTKVEIEIFMYLIWITILKWKSKKRSW